jgi:catechol 2,3-dioxygenase-like lactoylglutathione lyase family enzyme
VKELLMLKGFNHITIAVSDLDASLRFYTQLLGMRAHVRWDKGAYLSLGDLWFCLSCDEVLPAKDYSHLAFDIAEADFPAFAAKLLQAGVKEWKQNKSEGDSLYLLDPDGHQLEVHSGTLQSRLESLKLAPYTGLVWL